MTVKRFEAENMTEALRRIRTDLGEEAVILETRRVRGGGGILGLGARERVEVLAAVEPPSAREPKNSGGSTYDRSAGFRSVPSPDAALQDLHNPLQPRESSRSGIGRREELAVRFSESGIEKSLAEGILRACESDLSDVRLAGEIMRRIPVAPTLVEGGCARVALVGPTGVGKTTTTAKLAARYALTERKRVALVTMDTYRIGAVEQLKTYARMMGLPMEVVESPEEMAGAVARHADKDLVLIDTVGRSPHKALHLAEIKAFLNAAEPTETHLVLAAPYGLGYLFEAAEQFSTLEMNRLILTKLDEMPRWGAIASLANRTGLPVSFITDGQEVPRNLRPANAGEIALRILGGAG